MTPKYQIQTVNKGGRQGLEAGTTWSLWFRTTVAVQTGMAQEEVLAQGGEKDGW